MANIFSLSVCVPMVLRDLRKIINGDFSGSICWWNMHQENFYKPLEAIVSRWKWRASWGRTGNNNLSVANSRGEYKITDTNYQGSVGILNTTLKNSQLRWGNNRIL